MYFIQPSRQISSLEQVLDTLPSLQMITIEDIHRYDPTIIAIADVHDFLQYQWALPTIVIAQENEGKRNFLKHGNLALLLVGSGPSFQPILKILY